MSITRKRLIIICDRPEHCEATMTSSKDFLFFLSATATKYFGKAFLLCFLFASLHCPDIQANGQTYYCLNIKKVIDSEDEIVIDSEYESGKRLYLRYSSAGLSENFVVKKTPDMSLCPEDIKLVEIERQPFAQTHLTTYIVSIRLHGAVGSKISNYTERNLGKRIAIEIDGRILAIPKILDVVHEEMRLMSGWNLEEIQREFGKVSNSIVVRDNK